MKSVKNLLTFLLSAFLLPIFLLWAILLSASLPSASLLLPPPNTSEKRLDKVYLASVFKKQAEKAVNINIKLKIAIKLYVLVILF